ncbi:hypothetical protein [Pseudalkalibacillus sp. SCS-8]|uniref:hypothetical protein n=1 Tax=Pseudalkalibacillus nanhaiensis TaxID=3115291 RepID=UPI0032D9BC82
MTQHDQASSLRNKVKPVSNLEMNAIQDTEEIDVLNLPPRSSKHRKSPKKTTQKETPYSGKGHIWVTRGIVIAFIFLLFFTIFYFTNGFNLIPEIESESDVFIKIDR